MRRPRGSGTIVKKGDKYYARVRKSGQEVYGQARTTHAAAESDLQSLRRGAGKPKRVDVPTTSEWAYQFQLRGGRNPNTHNTDETTRLHHIEGSQVGRTPVDRLTRSHIQEWVNGLRKRDGAKPSPSYVRRCYAFVSMLLSVAVKEGLIQSSPATKISLPAVKERRNRVLSFGELSKLISNPQTEIDRIAVLCATLGLSRSEVVRIRWDGIHGRLLHIPGTKREARDRVVPLTPAALRAIRNQPRTDERIFPRHPSTLTHWWADRKEALGMPPETRLQDLRGTFVSLLIRSKVDARTVMELAGHSKVETTFKAYARSDFETRTNAVRGLERTARKGNRGNS